MESFSLWHAVLLGILEGLTEFIPVSSTGHLILLQRLLGWDGEKAGTFSIFIQAGAICAVVILYRRFFLGLFGLGAAPQDAESGFQGWYGLAKIGAACIPICAAGALLGSKIKAHLFYATPVAWALIVGGIGLIAAEALRRRVKVSSLGELSWRQCLLVGLFQCLALWPGMSRSAATIVGAMLLGFDRKLAAEFSFLVAVPVLGAAVAYDLLKNLHLLGAADIVFFLTGLASAFVTALLAVKLFMRIISRYSMRFFGYYRIVLGWLVLWLMG